MTLPITYADTETVHGNSDPLGGGGLSGWTSVINALTAFMSPPGATLVAGLTTTVTSGTTLTLTVASTTMQVLTGSSTQLVKLATTSVVSGAAWIISNQSSATATVESSGANTITTIPAGSTAVFTAKTATPTTAAGWAFTPSGSGISVALGKILTASNSLTLAGTDGTTMTFPGSSDTVVTLAAAQAISGKTATLSAGTTTVAPLNLMSGTNLTTPTAGAVEYDGNDLYLTAAGGRQVVDAEQFVFMSSSNTLTSQTAAQPIFDGVTTNGAVTLPVGSYFFESLLVLTSLAASGTVGFALGGTAVIGSTLWQAQTTRTTALATATAAFGSIATTTANTAIVPTGTSTNAWAELAGNLRVTTAGTVIPQVSLGTAAAAVVSAGSYFRIWQVGNATVTNVGSWS